MAKEYFDLQTHIGAMETELGALRNKSESDDRTISLIKHQYDELNVEWSAARADWDRRERELKTERDIAVRKAKEVEGILNNAAASVISGLRKMQGDETPEQIPDRAVAQLADSRLPKVSPSDDIEVEMRRIVHGNG